MKRIVFFSLSLLILSACSNGEAEYQATGNFDADELLISAQSSGEVVSLLAEEGASLKKGDVVALIDTSAQHLQRKLIRSQMAAAASRKVNVAQQTAPLRAALGNILYEKSRIEKLMESNAATRKQLEDIEFQRIHTVEQLRAQQERLEDANTSIDREIQAMEVQLEQLDLVCSKAVLKAPIDGQILEIYLRPGELAAPGKPLFSMANLNPLILRAYVSGDQLAEIKLKQQLTVLTDDGEGGYRESSGSITWISAESEFTPKAIQTKNERANRVYAIKIAVNNPDGLLKIGMYGMVKW